MAVKKKKSDADQLGDKKLRVNCTCSHEFQDQRYGKGVRVAVYSGKQGGSLSCTVCSRVHPKKGM